MQLRGRTINAPAGDHLAQSAGRRLSRPLHAVLGRDAHLDPIITFELRRLS
jgi:hypothetical protein